MHQIKVIKVRETIEETYKLIKEEIYDKAYVKKYTTGFEELKKHVANFTPEWAYGITTIKPEEIRKTAREMAHAAPAVIIHPGRHVSWYGDDTQRARAMAILNGLLGSWGRRGGFYFKEKISVPKYPHPKYHYVLTPLLMKFANLGLLRTSDLYRRPT